MQHARAVGDTRTLTLHHVHTDESLTITYKKNGQYDQDALKKINWLMRDWRKNEATTMDPQEIDLLWEVYQDVGATEPIEIVCGYRSPDTNEMLRHRSLRSGVARFSQHTLGKAIDFYIPGVNLEKLRATAMRLQGGGVGYYPTSGSPFVHLDVGNVRAWPRMTREQLVKLFPDGRTVHLPADGTPLPGYELAKADLERGHHTVAEPQKRSFLASLFNRDKDSEEAADNASVRAGAAAPRGVTATAPRIQVASAAEPAMSAAPAQLVPVPLPPRRPIYQIAAADSPPAPRAAPIQLASLSPNDIVSSRGLWETLAASAAAKAPAAETNALDVSGARRAETPSRDVTASIGPFRDRVPADVALAYAAQADTTSPPAARFERAAIVTSKGSASIANKPADAVTNTLQTRADERLDDPWLRGLVLAVNVQNSLVATQVGDPDFTSFTQFMTKPRSSVMMTFSTDPHLGMTTDQFSGSAVVFPATVTFAASRRATNLE